MLTCCDNGIAMFHQKSEQKMKMPLIILIALSSLIAGCSSDHNEPPSKDHIFKGQTDTLKTAKDVQQLFQHELNTHQQRLDSTTSQ